MRVMNKKALTLLELLIVIVIIGILLGFFGSAVSRVRELSRRALCANNMRQHGIAWYLYLDDNNELFPAYFFVAGVETDRAAYSTFGGKSGKCGDTDSKYAFDKRVLNRYLDINSDSSPAAQIFYCPDDKRPNPYLVYTMTNFEYYGNSYNCNEYWILCYEGNSVKRRPLSTVTSPPNKVWLEMDNPDNVPGHGGKGRQTTGPGPGPEGCSPVMVLFLDGHVSGPFKWYSDFEEYDPNTNKPVLCDVNGTGGLNGNED